MKQSRKKGIKKRNPKTIIKSKNQWYIYLSIAELKDFIDICFAKLAITKDKELALFCKELVSIYASKFILQQGLKIMMPIVEKVFTDIMINKKVNADNIS